MLTYDSTFTQDQRFLIITASSQQAYNLTLQKQNQIKKKRIKVKFSPSQDCITSSVSPATEASWANRTVLRYL